FWVADRQRGGVYQIDAAQFRVKSFLATGRDAHGLYVSRDSRFLYVTNRGEGSVSVIDFADAKITATWRIPGGSPDMGGISADGTTFWVAGRYNREVYAIDIPTGRLRARIKVGEQPHGLSIYPQPGRYSLGHTGVFR